MCPRFVAARPPAAAQPPSGDTSGEGDTTGAGGQGNQTADPPAPESSQAASHAGNSPGASDADDAADNAGDAGESGDECEKDEPTDRLEGVARNSPPGTPDGAVILPKVRTVISPGSARMHALGAMTGRFLTEQEAKRLETQKTLPPPELDSRGNVQAPSRHDFSVDPSSLGRTRLVGVPALQDHQRQGFHTRDGYGGLESLIQVEELGHADMFDLQEFSSADNPVVSDLLLSSRASTAPGDELESIRHSIPAQREMATLLSEYGVDRLPERTISTVSVLRRVLDRYRRVCHQLDASPSQSRQDALKAQDQLHAAKLSYEFDRAHWESERQQSADAATYTAERYQDDVKELVHEHNANKRGLQEEISKLRQELEDAHAYQRVLDRHVRESRFNVTDLMNFWATTPHWPAIGCASVIFYNIIKTALPFPRVGKPSLLRLRRLICSGIFLNGAVSWLQEDRPVHTRFCQDDLVEMLSRMMFWNKLNESHWPNHRDVEEELLPEDFEPEQDDKSKDADWSAADEGVPAEDVSEVESVSESAATSKRRKRRVSQTPSVDQPPAKRSRGGSRSLLAQKDYSDLTPAEKAVVEIPENGMVSWRHHGIRVKHVDPSSTKNSQTLGLPDYSPIRHDLALLK
ncbi:hypothetical protein PR003_g8248 [Phytophthora rubi]|uniref:Uncharacterized protein n=1 Tax=Phytophthora rubi TaxID=129364 RepID=A0A6A4FRK9_9STRA|nr:hypothetical protein PR003_g8248 [Phytophthora rubi]